MVEKHFLSILLVMVLAVCGQGLADGCDSDGALYKDVNADVEQRVEDLLSRMTLEEQIAMIVGDASAGTSLDGAHNLRLGIPRLSMTDGPHGASFAKHFGKGATCFPVGVNMGSSWNVDLIERVGKAMAEETEAQGRNTLLGPCVNIHRTPMSGRNFESFSEDPYVAGQIGVAYVKGVQSEGVVASVKHFACNNQEWHRMYVDAVVSDRALRELYLPAFKACVQDANVWSVMAAYNRLNGPYACANKVLLTDILKDEWGFKGFVVSDWGAVHSTKDTALAGCDLEMGGTRYMAEPLLEMVKKGEVSEEVVKDKVRRILRVMMVSGIFDTPWKPRKNAEELYKQPFPDGMFAKSMYGEQLDDDMIKLDSPEHRSLALEAARDSLVLLKNTGVLPLHKDKVAKVAVIGPNAGRAQVGGGGSSEVKPSYKVSPLEGIGKKLAGKAEVVYARGCEFDRRYNYPVVPPSCFQVGDMNEHDPGLLVEYFNNLNLEGEPVFTQERHHIIEHWLDNAPGEGLGQIGWSARWTGKFQPPYSGKFRFALFHHGAFYANEQGSGMRLFLDGECIVDDWNPTICEVRKGDVYLDADKVYDFKVEYHTGGEKTRPIAILAWKPMDVDPVAEAVKVAKDSGAAVLCVGYNQFYSGENNDLGSLFLPGDQERLIKAVAAVNPRTVVVMYNGNPVMMGNWIDDVEAVIEAWYPGQEGGHAVADVLFGDVNPSGKLTVTFAEKREDYSDLPNYPGDGTKVEYAEGIFVGYRHFDRAGLRVQYPFGHGLSYTKFKYSGLKVKAGDVLDGGKVTVRMKLKNVGKVYGKEVVQLYVRDVKSSVERPVKELKGFEKVGLEPGESKVVTFELDKDAFSFYDSDKGAWVLEPGEFEVLVGSSSADIRLKDSFEVK